MRSCGVDDICLFILVELNIWFIDFQLEFFVVYLFGQPSICFGRLYIFWPFLEVVYLEGSFGPFDHRIL